MKEYTPENIEKLNNNEVFIFGSNEGGRHEGGAAKVAFENFGAKWGKGYGLEGMTFALPTKNKKFRTLPLATVKNYLKDLIEFVYNNPNLKFYLTKIGCGLAGFRVEEIKGIFWEAIEEYNKLENKEDSFPINLIIPEEFDKSK